MSVDAGSVVGRAQLVDEWTPALEKMAREMTIFGEKVSKTGKDIAETGKNISKSLATISVPFLAVGTASLKFATDFESSFAGVRKTVDATAVEFSQLENEIRSLAKTSVPVDVNTLNRIAESAGQLGIAKGNITQFTKTMAELGETTNLTAENAATATAQFQNIFGAAGFEIDRLGATLVKLGNSGASTESQILEMGVRIAGVGKQIGLTQGEVLAFASTLSSLGIESEAGGSAISKVMADIAVAVSTGGRELENFSQVAGRSASEFSELFRTNAAQAVAEFVTGLGRMRENGQDVILTLEKMGISEVRMRQALLSSAGAGSLLTDQLALQAEAWEDNTALTKEAAERHKTFASQLQFVKNDLYDTGVTIGQSLLPIMKDLLTAIKPLLETINAIAKAFAALPQPVRLAAVAFVALANAIGPVTIIIGKFKESVGILIAYAPKVATALYTMLGPWGLIGAAIASSLLALNAWIKTVRDEMQAEIETMVSGANRIGEAWSGLQDLRDAGGRITAEQYKKMGEDLDAATAAKIAADEALQKFLQSRGKRAIEELGEAERKLGSEVIANAKITKAREQVLIRQYDHIKEVTTAERDLGGAVNITTQEMADQSKALGQLRESLTRTAKQNRELEKAYSGGSQIEIDALLRSQSILNGYVSDLREFGKNAAEGLKVLREEEYDSAKAAEKARESFEALHGALGDLDRTVNDFAGKSTAEFTRGVERLEADAKKIIDRLNLKKNIDHELDYQIRVAAIDEVSPALRSIKQNFLDFLRELGEGSVARGEAVFAEMAKRFGWTVDAIEADLQRLQSAEVGSSIRGASRSGKAAFEDEIKSFEQAVKDGFATQEDAQAAINKATKDYWNDQLSEWSEAFDYLSAEFGGFFSYLSSLINSIQQAQQLSANVSGIATNLGASAGAASAFGSVAGWAAVFVAAYELIQSRHSEREGRQYGGPVQYGFEFGADVARYWSNQGKELAEKIGDTVKAFAEAIGGSLRELETIGLQIRNDGEKVRAFIGDEFLGVFDSIEDAIEEALRVAITSGGASFEGLSDLVQQGLDSLASDLAAPDFDEITEFLGELREVSELGLSSDLLGLRADIEHLDALRDSIRQVGQASAATAAGFAQAAGREAGIWQDFFDSITGRTKSAEEILAQKQKELELGKAELKIRQATLQQRYLEIKATIEAIKAGRLLVGGGGGGGGAPTGGMGGTGIGSGGVIFGMAQAFVAAGTAIAQTAVGVVAATSAISEAGLNMIAALEQEGAAILELLRALETLDIPDVSNINIGGGRGSGRSDRESVREFVDNRTTELSLAAMSEYARRMEELRLQYEQLAAQAGGNAALLAQLNDLRAREAEIVREEIVGNVVASFQEFLGLISPFDQARQTAEDLIRQIQESPFGDARKARMIARVLHEVELQLERMSREMTAGLMGSLIQDLERFGVEESALSEARKALAVLEHSLRMEQHRAQIAMLKLEGNLTQEAIAQLDNLYNMLASIDPTQLLNPSNDDDNYKTPAEIARERAEQRRQEEAAAQAERVRKAWDLWDKYTNEGGNPVIRNLRQINNDFRDIIAVFGETQQVLELRNQALADAIDAFLQPIRDAQRDAIVGPDSVLSTESQWAAIQAEMQNALLALQAGDLDVVEDAPRIYQDFMRILREMSPAGTEGFMLEAERAQAFLQQILDIAPGAALEGAGIEVAGLEDLTALAADQSAALSDILAASNRAADTLEYIAASHYSAFDGVA